MRYEVTDLKERLGMSRIGAASIRAPSLHSCAKDIRFVCVTGATGWLGRHVVQAWLRQATLHPATPIHVIVPLRADNAAHAYARLRHAWSSVSPLMACLDQKSKLPVQITAIPIRSLAAPLPPLPLPVDSVIHCAADMSLALNLDQAWGANVDAVRHLWRWALAHGARRFDHVSTLSVFVAGQTPPGVIGENDSLERAHALYGGYAASKWCAEAWLMNAAGMDLGIHRLGLLSYSPQHGWAPGDGIAAWAQAWRKWGRPAFVSDDQSAQVDFSSPVTAAQGIIDSICHQACGVWHWTRPIPVPASLWIDVMDELYGSSPGTWPQQDPLGKLALRAVGRWSNPVRAHKWWWHDLFQSTHHTYGTSAASQLFQTTPWDREELKQALLHLP